MKIDPLANAVPVRVMQLPMRMPMVVRWAPERPHHRAPMARPHAIAAPRRRESRQTRRVRTTRTRSSKSPGSRAGEPPPGRPRAGRSEVTADGGAR